MYNPQATDGKLRRDFYDLLKLDHGTRRVLDGRPVEDLLVIEYVLRETMPTEAIVDTAKSRQIGDTGMTVTQMLAAGKTELAAGALERAINGPDLPVIRVIGRAAPSHTLK